MTETESTNTLESFVDALLQNAGQLMLIVDHMSRHPSDDAEESFDDVLRRLLSEALEPVYRERDPSDFATATALLVEARNTVGEELFLVEPDPHGPNGHPAGGRRARRRSRRRRG